jgi:tripartite-type tricarboxylate transporter receptor subunit TctC
MRSRSLVLGAVGAAMSGLAVSAPAVADPVADFYKNNAITVILPIGPGGTYDFYGRLGAAIMEKHLPGNPKVITQLMTGAGGAKASNYMASVAPKNGTFLVSLHASAPQNQVLGVTGIRYDLGKFLMVGQFLPLNSSLTVWKATSPAHTIQEAMQKEVILGSTGKGSYQYQLPALLNVMTGTKFKIVLGYKSVSEENLAMEQGEIHGRGGTTVSWAITQPAWVKEDKIAHLVQVGTKRARGFESVPLATELVKTEEDRQALNLVSGGALMGRSLASTPGVPADRAKALRAAFDKGMQDPEILAKAKEWKLDLDPASGEDLQKVVAGILSTPPAVVEKVKQLLDIKKK